MSIEAELRAEFDRWEHRQNQAYEVLPYFLLTISVAITFVQLISKSTPSHLSAVLGLSLAAALWLLLHRLLRPKSRTVMALYYAVLLALIAGLVSIAPWYGFFAFVGYPAAFQFLTGRWRYAGAAATATISGTAYLGGVASITADHLWWMWLAVGLLSSVVAGMFFNFAEMTDHRNSKQKRALTELHEANVKLEAALKVNATLQDQLLNQAREAGVLDERQRMAREIHDTLAQSLAGILTQLQAGEQTLGQPAELRRHLRIATELTRESLTEARRSVHAVEPSVLADARLPEAIGEVTRQWAEVNQVEAALTTTGEARPMHTDVEVALLRTAQEALANVAKHAQASRVRLTLSYMEDLVSLDVRDDGIGFEPDSKRDSSSAEGGFGLAAMRQRVQRLTGRLEIESEPGAGTAISATLPAIPAIPATPAAPAIPASLADPAMPARPSAPAISSGGPE